MNQPIKTRFWSKVNKLGPNDCWEWMARRNPKGYGTFRGPNGCTNAHRIAWELTFGPIPKGQPVLHDCPGGDNPACCNPAHLWIGTVGDNNRDRHSKGRTACGIKIPLAKLTDQIVQQIRADYAQTSKLSQRSPFHLRQWEIAEKYGVGPDTISKIVTRKLWKHV